MMKLILFVLFRAIFSVQSKITAKNRTVINAGDPFTLECDKPTARWKLNGKTIAHCVNCPSSTCKLHQDYRKRITVFCTRNKSVLHFTSTQLDDIGSVKCPENDSESFPLLVRIPVTSVSIQSQSQVLHENEDGIFVCKVEESKPEASFQWIIVYKNGSSQEIQQKSIISKTLKGKLWQTTSTLKLNMKRDYQKIMCNATIENMPWTNSEYQSLDIKYHPIIKMNDTITVIENETNVLNCSAEGNPKPTIKWKIGHNIVKSKLLKVSFTRYNATAVQCIATANSTKHGILESSKNISIFVTYSPEITIRHNVTRLQQKAQISCTAQASPNKIQYKMVQKWANTEKKNISAKQQNFRNFSFQDLGNWICLASNDVPAKGYYSKKSVEIKVNVSAQFKGDKNETAMVGSKKRLKTCFYCYPEATEVKWYKGNEEMSSDRIYYVPAEDGLFPFTGNCSILELDITEKEIQIYYLNVTNPVGKRTFEFTLDSGIPADSPIYIIVSCVIAVFVIIIIIGGIVYVKFRRSSKKNQSNIYFSNPANNLRSSEGHEYANIYDVPRSSGQPTGNEIPYDDRPMSQRHEYANIYDVPTSSGQPTGNEIAMSQRHEYATIYDVHRSSGQLTGNEIPYDDIAMSQNHTYENEPFYIDVTNAPIRTGHALTAESEYTIMYNVPRNSGQPTGNEIPYDDIAMSQNHTYENEPFYIDVTNAPIRTGHALTAESEYTIMYNVPRSSGQPTGNEIPDDDIAMSQNHTYENEPFYIDVTNAPIRTGHALTAESEYTIMYNVPRSSGQPTGNEIPYDDIAMSQNHTYENEPFYIDVINTPIRTGHLDYEDLNN